MSLVDRAEQFATLAHGNIDHRRKYTNEPYITHPAAVVALVRSVPHTDEMLAAAWLHDTVEDTGVKHLQIEQEFGAQVAELVWYLTDISKPEDGNREFRKALDRKHLARATAEAKTIKLADLIDNSRSILARDPDFARVYLAEKRLLLDEALREGDAKLWKLADALVEGGILSLGIAKRYRGILSKLAEK